MEEAEGLYNGKELIDPRAELVYGSLGNGLDPKAIQPRPMDELS